MGCDFPLKAFRSTEVNPSTGKRQLTFNPLRALNSVDPVEVPCGRCMGCKLDRSRQWAVRCHHEAKQHAASSFLTLTYADEHLPADYGLHMDHWQDFIKLLRYHIGVRIKFYGCGEYGEKFLRPHYHALIFGWAPDDQRMWSKGPKGHPIFRSDRLDGIWKKGAVYVGAVTFQSAGYVARYCTKKIQGHWYPGKAGPVRAEDNYTRVHPFTGAVHQVRREFSTMSKGIGRSFVSEFKSDLFPSGFLVADGQKVPIPRYYLNQLTQEERDALKRSAKLKAARHRDERSTTRRIVRATVRDARIAPLSRNQED